MSTLAKSSYSDIRKFREEVRASLSTAASLQEAAQMTVTQLYERFKEDILLVRFFASLPMGLLPERNKEFVRKSVAGTGEEQALHSDLRVLTLLGTAGDQPKWNDPYQSQGHLGIPLISERFIEGIPMISRLMKELGIQMDWLNAPSEGVEIRTIKKISGLFYVPEARSAVDHAGRKIISAQEFVSSAKVRTVFGVGANYLSSDVMIVLVAFCRTPIDRHITERFLILPSEITMETSNLVANKKFFGRKE